MLLQARDEVRRREDGEERRDDVEEAGETRLEAEDGSAIEVLDFCPRHEGKGRMYRPVAISRIVRPVAGSPRIRVVLRPMRDYGAALA